MERLVEAMCKALRIDVETLRGSGRTQEVSDKRTAIAYALLTGGYSAKEVAEAVGRDRTTALACARRVNAWYRTRLYYNQMTFVERAQEALRRAREEEADS